MRGLYAIVDPERCGGRDPLVLSRAILRGGCCALQLRSKRGDDAAYLRLARPVLDACRAAGVPFFVNDRVQAAATLGADGLHLGQRDAPLSAARAVVGSMPIGLSTHDPVQAAAAVEAGADLVGFGPIYPTRSKRDPDPTVGPALAGALAAELTVPLVAIGGITVDNVPSLIAAGVRVAAVIASLADARDPERVAAQLHGALLGREPR